MNYPKSARVRKRSEFLQFFKKSDVIRLNGCTVFRIPNGHAQPRLGVTVKSKQGSVVRNRFKRRIRETYRKNRAHLGAFDYNVVVQVPLALRGRERVELLERMLRSLTQMWGNG